MGDCTRTGKVTTSEEYGVRNRKTLMKVNSKKEEIRGGIIFYLGGKIKQGEENNPRVPLEQQLVQEQARQ